ncbi:MAG: hypothetical protein ABI760_00610 [Ferruginibacter sp.]
MKPAILICLFVIIEYVANAQFTITPQLGFENSRTSIGYNELPYFTPTGANLSPQAGIRLDYKFRNLHGPFLGMNTSRSIVKFNFSDPQTGMSSYAASRGNTQIRLEGGYQVSSKPIYFKKPGSTNKTAGIHCQKNAIRKSCGNPLVRNSCGSKTNKDAAAKSPDKGSWVRIQPSLGIAYIPFNPATEIYIKSKGTPTSYEYNAGNWKTALISGVGFEFGNNSGRTFVVSINYLKGMGNLTTQSINTVSGNKPGNTSLKSETSGWNLTMGIPISLGKKKPAVKQIVEKIYKEEKKCSQYRMRCHKAY